MAVLRAAATEPNRAELTADHSAGPGHPIQHCTYHGDPEPEAICARTAPHRAMQRANRSSATATHKPACIVVRPRKKTPSRALSGSVITTGARVGSAAPSAARNHRWASVTIQLALEQARLGTAGGT